MKVTIVVLLILAGITISYVMGDNGIFHKATDTKLQTDIAQWRERLELAKGPIFIEGLGTFDADKYFDYIKEQGIINNRETDVVDNEDGTYDVTTKPGYIFEVVLVPSPEKPTDAEITYIGQAGKILPVIRRLEVSATSTSITGKATLSRLGNGTIKYYYKLKTENDSEYKEITNVSQETGATQSSGIVAGTEYVIKVVAKNNVGEVEKNEEITATKIFVESITLNKTTEEIEVGETVTLIATVEPDDATNKNIIWESSNTEVATVNSSGVVTGKAEGTATITVKATDGSNKVATCIVTVKIPTAAEVEEIMQTKNKTVQDENGNKVVIPGGFKVLSHGTKSTDICEVVYNYDTNHKPCVQDGIVIADNEDNQFVWIPIGEVKNKNGTTTMITLGRYIFNATSGTATLQQDAINYSSVTSITIGSDKYEELTSSSGNTSAKNLKNFIEKTKVNGGYYFARYEASKGNDSKIDSKANKMPWSNLSQINAATAARGMYSSSYVESDLINSYSWDTAIIFIQKCSGNSNYANKKPVNSSEVNTGQSGDKACNIYEMAENCEEWSTEHCTNSSNSAVTRGARYVNKAGYPNYRHSIGASKNITYASLRALIYFK